MVRIDEGIMAKKIYSVCVLAVFAVLLTLVSGCIDNLQSDPEELIQGQEGPFVITIKASKAITTKALNHPDEHNIISTWTQGEPVTVYNKTQGVALSGCLSAQSGGSSTTKLKGSVTGRISAGDKLTLSYGSNDYAGQDGTLNVANRTTSISQRCDYALATVSVQSIELKNSQLEVTIEGGVAAFVNQQAIINFGFKDEMGNAISNPESVTIHYGSTGVISLTGLTTEKTYAPNNSQNGVLFVAIPGISDEELSIEITTNGKTYYYENEHATIENGKYYRAIVYMYNDTTSPLTFEAIKAGTTISFTQHSTGDLSCPIEYQRNHGDSWTAYTGPVTLTNVGDKVRFRGTNTTYSQAYGDPYYSFDPSDSCYVYGNIMSLVKGEGFAKAALTLEATDTFSGLFRETKIKNHKSKNIVLPATTLQDRCYWGMFWGCNGIYKAPELPATQLKEKCYFKMFLETGLHEVPSLPATNLANASQCYEYMFSGCTGLTTIPANLLQATTLDQSCYTGMFSGCTGLTTIPGNLLPAKTLAYSCYSYMFDGCTGLTEIPSTLFSEVTTLNTACYQYMFRDCSGLAEIPEGLLPITSLQTYCYGYMFSGCKGLTSVPDGLLPASSLALGCYEHMFENCSLITYAPTLPAGTLQTNCYSNMFNGCTKLAWVVCLATDITASGCTENWLSGVATSGSFRRHKDLAVGEGGWTFGASGIPSGWSVTWSD